MLRIVKKNNNKIAYVKNSDAKIKTTTTTTTKQHIQLNFTITDLNELSYFICYSGSSVIANVQIERKSGLGTETNFCYTRNSVMLGSVIAGLYCIKNSDAKKKMTTTKQHMLRQ